MGSLFSSCFPVHRSSDSTHTDRGVDLSTVDRASPAAAEKRQRIAQATEERLKQSVEKAMAANGFANAVAENSYQYAGGDGNAVEDAPIGYYQYHFWMHDEKYKAHENWVARSETTGSMCISVIEEQHARDGRAFVRMLVRTQFGSYKSMVLFEDDILQLVGQSPNDHSSRGKTTKKRRPNRLQILGAALHMYIEHERDQIAMMEEEHGALSVRTSSSISSMASFDLARTLPSSRLYEAAVGLMDSESSLSSLTMDDASSISGLERRLSQVSEHNINWRSTADSSTESTKQRLRRVMRLNPFELAKKFVLVKEEDLYWALLKLEQSLQPSTAHVNVVCIADTTEKSNVTNWQAFCSSIGTCISAKANDGQSSNIFKSHQKKSPMSTEEVDRRIGFVVREMVLTEARYLAVILQIEQFLMRPMKEKAAMSQQSYDIIFKGISNVVDIHRRLLSDICGGSMGCIPDEWTGEREIEERVDAAFGIELINFESVTNAFQRLCSSKDLLEYDQIMCYYDDRMALLLSQLQENPEVAQVVLDYERLCSQANNACVSATNDDSDDAASDPGFSIAEVSSHKSIKDQSMERRPSLKMIPNEILGRLSSLMDRNMGNLFQRPTRYRLMIDELLSVMPDDHAFIDAWKDCLQNLCRSLALLESHKERTDISRELFAKVVGIDGAPHSLINAKRQFVSKCTFFQVERGSLITDRKLTFFLFSDVLVVAHKRFSSKTRQKSGKLTDRRPSYKQADDVAMAAPKKYEFVLMVNVNDISLHALCTRAKSKRGKETRTYSSEMTTVDGAHHQFILAATSHEKLSIFMEALNHRQKQLLLDTSMAQVYVASSVSDQSKESDTMSSIYYYAFKSLQDYVKGSAWKSTSKGGTLVIFLDQSASANSSCIEESLARVLDSADHDHLTGLIVVQSMNGAFRVYVRSRELIVASSNNFETSNSFSQNISNQLHHIVKNCNLLDGIYPPFGAAHQKMLQEQLDRHVAPFAKGLANKISRFWNKFKKADTALTPEELDQQADELTSEQFYDLADQMCEMRLKDANESSYHEDNIEATIIEPNVQSAKIPDNSTVSNLQSKPKKSVLSRVLQRMNGSLHVMD